MVRINKNDLKKKGYSQLMREYGSRGGSAKAAKYAEHFNKLRIKIIDIYMNTYLTQKEIAKYLGCSVGFVNKNVDRNMKRRDLNFEVYKLDKEDLEQNIAELEIEYFKLKTKINDLEKSKTNQEEKKQFPIKNRL